MDTFGFIVGADLDLDEARAVAFVDDLLTAGDLGFIVGLDLAIDLVVVLRLAGCFAVLAGFFATFLSFLFDIVALVFRSMRTFTFAFEGTLFATLAFSFFTPTFVASFLPETETRAFEIAFLIPPLRGFDGLTIFLFLLNRDAEAAIVVPIFRLVPVTAGLDFFFTGPLFF